MQDHNPHQDISDDESEGECEVTAVTKLSSHIDDDNSDPQQQLLLLGLAHQDKSSQATRIPLRKKQSRANTVIARPLLPNPQKPPGSMAPPLLKRQKSALLNTSSESDRAPSALVLPQPKSSGNQNARQPKASADYNVPQYQKVTFEVAKRFMEAIVFMKTPRPIVSNDKYSMVEEAWKLAIKAQNCHRALAGAPPGTPSVYQQNVKWFGSHNRTTQQL
jgi:hypothetical protein